MAILKGLGRSNHEQRPVILRKGAGHTAKVDGHSTNRVAQTPKAAVAQTTKALSALYGLTGGRSNHEGSRSNHEGRVITCGPSTKGGDVWMPWQE